MVLERAARMSERSSAPTVDDSAEKAGMKMAADYLGGEVSELDQILLEQPPADQSAIRKGMVSILLRNIILPRDETLLSQSEKAIQGILQLGPSGEINSLCQEIKQILGQYNQHKEQVQQQLDDAIRAQLQQQLAQQGHQVDDVMSINPAMHPKYNEEIARAMGDLNEQYNQAMTERKDSIQNRLSL